MSTLRAVLCSVLVTIIAGCASISIDQPKDGSVVKMPQPIMVTESGNVSLGDPLFDNFNLSRYNGQNWQYVPQSTLRYASPGAAHTLFVSARDGKSGANISQSSTFTVSACPLCYTCPAGSVVHPITGQCCDGGMCDSLAFANFGPSVFANQECQQFTFPGSTKQWLDLDCISTNLEQIRGTALTPQMLAVRFTPTESKALRHVQVPIGWQSGVNSLQVWVTADSANAPGQSLETVTVNNIRTQPTPTTVDAPAHIFFAGTTPLTAGTPYWLVLGPGGADTVINWNTSLLLNDSSIPANTTYLLNTTSTSLAGPWNPKGITVIRRPAFEVDVR